MSIHTMRLALGIMFLFLGTLILTRQWLMPELFGGYDSLRMNLGGILALVFAGLNLARWYTARSFAQSTQTAVRYPLRRDPSAAPHVEPNPEFDFFKPPEESPGSANPKDEKMNQ